MISKRQIRQEVKERIGEIEQELREVFSRKIVQRLASCEFFSHSKVILLYHPLPDEPDLWINPSLLSQKTLLLPSVEGDDMNIRPYKGANSLTRGAFGIWEPSTDLFEQWSQIDLCLIPGRGFDLSGHRLGRGKGYYDKILSKIGAPKIGIGFECQLYPEIPIEPHDIPLQGIITENNLYLTSIE